MCLQLQSLSRQHILQAARAGSKHVTLTQSGSCLLTRCQGIPSPHGETARGQTERGEGC